MFTKTYIYNVNNFNGVIIHIKDFIETPNFRIKLYLIN